MLPPGHQLQPHWGDICKLGSMQLRDIIAMAVPLGEKSTLNVHVQLHGEVHTLRLQV